MLNNKQLLAIVATLFSQEALALNVHRHVHNHAHDKKAVVYQETDVVTVTDWSTVTVWEDYPASTQKTFFKGGAHTHHAFSTSTSTSTVPTSTSTSVTSSSSVSTSSSAVPTTPSSSSSAVPTTYSTSTSTLSPSTFSTSYVAPTTSTAAAVVSTTYPAVATSSAVAEKADVVAIEAVTSTTAAAAFVASTTSTTAAAAATAASTSSSSSSSSSSSGSGKRGLAYNTGSLLSNFLGTGTKCTWSYNWGATADSSAPSDLEYVPMLWSPAKVDGWTAAAEAAISGGSKYFLSFNECDNSGQCDTDAATAAAAHQTYLNPYSSKVKIGTPAITNSQSSGEGIEWLTNFLTACNGACDYDFCPIHWYNTADSTDFLTHLLNAYDACGKDIWVTEFAPTGSDDEINSFLIDVMDQMDNNSTFSFVQRYSYFWAATGSLLSSETSLSTYGNTYAYE